MTPYAELQTTTNYGFLRGASQPGELVLAAKALGHPAIGIADRNTLAGVVRAWSQGKAIGQRALTGSRLVFADGTPEIVVYPSDRDAWGRLTRLLTLGQRRAKKGECHLVAHDLTAHAEGQLMLVVPPARLTPAFENWLRGFAGDHPGRVWLLAPAPMPPRISSAWRGSTPSPGGPARRWWPATTCSTTAPNGGRCRTC